MDEGRVKGDAISIERDCGELEVQSVVVPLIIADLREWGRGKTPLVTSSSGDWHKALPLLLGVRGQFLIFPVLSTGLTGERLPPQFNNILAQNLSGNRPST